MGQSLYQAEPVFKNSLLKSNALFEKYAGWSILQEMLKEKSVSRMDQPEVSQPARFHLASGFNRPL
jgi:acyl transferase domain-containing protein